MRRLLLAATAVAALAACSSMHSAAPAASAEPVRVYAAGSLREALTNIAQDYEARTGQKVALTFGASGLLRGRIEQGEPAQVFEIKLLLKFGFVPLILSRDQTHRWLVAVLGLP